MQQTIVDGQTIGLPQASLIKGRFGGIVYIRVASIGLHTPISESAGHKKKSTKVLFFSFVLSMNYSEIGVTLT